jgi:hypothetical protein
MAQHLFPHFLNDPAEYAKAEAYWRRLWDGIARFTGQQYEWRTPWLQTAYADGTPFRDGDPIFSACSPNRGLGVRVIQYAPTSEETELDFWPDTVGDEWSGEIRTLVISCALSEQAADIARDLILSWMRYGKVSISTGPDGRPVVSRPQAAPPLKLPAPESSGTWPKVAVPA